MTIFLVGPRASGKTRIGGALAAELGWVSVDTDHFMYNDSGLTVAEVVSREGWPGFRRRESIALRRVAQAGRVVATGGGIILDPANVAFMRLNGMVFYLDAPEWLLVRRLSRRLDNPNRPSLTGKSIADEVHEVLQERRPLYFAAAHRALDASRPPREVVRQAFWCMPGASRGNCW